MNKKEDDEGNEREREITKKLYGFTSVGITIEE